MSIELNAAQANECTILMSAIEAKYRAVGESAYDAATITLEDASDLPEVQVADNDPLFTRHGIEVAGGHDRSAWTLLVAGAGEADQLEDFPIYYGDTEGPTVNSYQEMIWEWETAIEGAIVERDRYREEFADRIREAADK